MKRIVLLVDNNKDFLATRAEFLENAGYRVITASTQEGARQVMRQQHLHLALLDLRIDNDDDDRDISGLMLAEEDEFQAIPKIILTGFPSWETVREAMALSSERQPPAVDFLAKKEGPEAMIEAVEEAFEQHVRVNLSLELHWQAASSLRSFSQLTCEIEPSAPPERLVELVGEMEDAFRKLFYDYQSLLLGPVLWKKDGQLALQCVACAPRRESPFLVTVGQKSILQQSQRAFDELAPAATGPGATRLHASSETVHYAAVAWQLVGADLEELQTLAAFYREKTPRQSAAALEGFLSGTLALWRQQGRTAAEQASLSACYCQRLGFDPQNMPLSALNARLQKLSAECTARDLPAFRLTGDKLRLKVRKRSRDEEYELSFANPLALLYNLTPLDSLSVTYCASPGDLDPETLLVNSEGEAWLTDFSQACLAPPCQDYVRLENAFHFKLGEVGGVQPGGVQRITEYEAYLLAPNSLSEAIRVDDVASEHKKATTVIQAIRSQAAGDPGCRYLHYLVELYFDTLSPLLGYDPALRRSRVETSGLFYRLVFAAQVSDKILLLTASGADENQDQQETPEVRFDPAKQVFRVGNRQIDLTPREHDLLLYLYNNEGKLLKREEIVRGAFNIPKPSKTDTDSLLNTNLGRLRGRIEADPDHPQYIQTVHGKGIRFQRQPQAPKDGKIDSYV